MLGLVKITTRKAATVGKHTGTLNVLGSEGDTTLTWDVAKPDTVEEVRAKFDALIEAGYAGFKTDGGDASSEQIKAFDPEARQIVMTRPLQGG